MRNRFKNILFGIGLTGSILCGANVNAQDAADMPLVMSFKTSIYGTSGPDNSFTVYLGSTEKDVEFYVDAPTSQEYVFVDPYGIGTDENGDRGVIATAIPLSATLSNNEVKIYGDASKLDYIDVHGCYITDITLSDALSNLSVIDLSHNELTAIDLSKLTSLASIDLLDNSFTVPSRMKIGTNHPDLQILSVGINDVIDPELDLKNFPRLQYFSARNNYGLTSVDPTQCPELVSLVLEVTNISELDVSKNLKLDVLNISNTKINKIDISKNVNLGEFYGSHEGSYNVDDSYKFTSIDVSHNPLLQYLDMSGNKLTEIDLTNNPNLILLYLQKNLIKQIDLSNNQKLSNVNLSNNLFNFATLPLPREGWDYLYYRSPLACDMKYKVNQPIDFSKEVIRAPYKDEIGNTITPSTYITLFAEPRIGETYEIPSELYSFDNGIVTVKEAFADSVYVEFFCDAFPDWTLRSANFKVKTPEEFDLPSLAFKFNTTADIKDRELSFKMAATSVAAGLQLPVDLTVRTDDKTVVLEKAITSETLPTTDNVKIVIPAGAQTVNFYLTDGYSMTGLAVDGINMKSIDLSESEIIRNLSLTNTGLPEIDLGYNGKLSSLDLSNNALTSIGFEAVRGDYEKYYLRNVNLANNQLTKISATVPEVIQSINLDNNKFNAFDFKYYSGLESISMADNKLEGEIDLSKVEHIKNLNLRGNNINEIKLGNIESLVTLDLSGNKLSLATLPLVNQNKVAYVYAPQQKYNILSAGAAIDLSSQNLNNTTQYVWKESTTNATIPASDLKIENGSTKFGANLVGKTLYCEMTNPVFGAFANSPLTTTDITVMEAPSNFIGQFTTTESGPGQIGFRFVDDNSHAVYIDWNGDGSQFDEYAYDYLNNAIYRDCTTIAGKTAKIYTYEPVNPVNMLFTYGIKMSDIDLTPITNLEALNLHGAGLTDGHIKLPQSNKLFELVLDGNNFENQSFAEYKGLSSLNLAANRYKTFDMSLYPNVFFAQLSDNQIETIKFGGNDALYQIDLTNNRISEIDITGAPNLAELLIPDNRLSEIDLSPIQARLRALNIAGNYFTFATLPRVTDFNPAYMTTYRYSNQHPVDAACVHGKVDLSEQAVVNETPTSFRWFLGNNQGDLYYDDYYEMFVGEELEGPDVSDDPEYSVDGGVTSFHYTQRSKVICAMTNSELPNLILYTSPTAIDEAGVENITVDNNSNPVYYNLQGLPVAHPVPGNIYILRQGNKTSKVLYR